MAARNSGGSGWGSDASVGGAGGTTGAAVAQPTAPEGAPPPAAARPPRVATPGKISKMTDVWVQAHDIKPGRAGFARAKLLTSRGLATSGGGDGTKVRVRLANSSSRDVPVSAVAGLAPSRLDAVKEENRYPEGLGEGDDRWLRDLLRDSAEDLPEAYKPDASSSRLRTGPRRLVNTMLDDVLTALVPNGEKKRIEFSILANRMRKDASEGAERAALYDRALDLALDTINHREAAFVVTKRYWLNGVEDKATRVLEAMDVRGRAVVQGVAATSHALKQRVARLQKTRAPPIERVAAEAVGSDEVPARSARPRRTPGRNRYNNEDFTDPGSTDEEEIVGQDAGEAGAPAVDEDDDADEEDDAMEGTSAGGQNVAAAVPSTRRTSYGSYHGCSPDDDTDNPKAISFDLEAAEDELRQHDSKIFHSVLGLKVALHVAAQGDGADSDDDEGDGAGPGDRGEDDAASDSDDEDGQADEDEDEDDADADVRDSPEAPEGAPTETYDSDDDVEATRAAFGAAVLVRNAFDDQE